MYLSKLELVGFKSFPKKTGLLFNEGVTAIVGPNGCGKSNIIDAIRWVIGEQRASVLRSDKMENVIFNGTGARRPLSMAEVSLTIENTKGILPTEYSEVTISRRLFRNGDSEYLLNKTQCRLKDIVELFMDTGMGANAYSVIELKMIETILSDRGGDRRLLFEEAAGVTRYKQRRREALRKLDATRGDLERVDDILREVEKKVRSLERQAKKAEEYTLLDRQREQLEVVLLHREFRRTTERIEPLQEKLDEARKTRSHLDEQLSREEIALADLEQEQAEIESQLAEANRDFAEVSERIATVDRQRAVAVERRGGLEAILARATREIDEARGAIEALAADREEVETSRKEISRLRAEAQVAFEEIAVTVEREATILAEKKSEARQAQEEVVGVLNRIGELRGEEERIRTRVEAIEERLARFDTEDAALALERTEAIESLAGVANEIDAAAGFLATAEDSFSAAEERREKLRTEIDEIDRDLTPLRDRRASVRTSIEFLSNLVSSDEAVGFLAERAQASGGKLTTVADLIDTTPEHLTAVAAALGDAADYIVVADEREARAGLGILREEERGNATFVCLDRLPKVVVGRTKSERSLAQIVVIDERFRELTDLLLGDAVLADSADDALGAAALAESGRFVTPDGTIATATGQIFGGSAADGANVSIGRDEKLAAFASEIAELEKEIVAQELRRQQTEAERGGLDAQRLSDETRKAQREYAALEQKKSGLEFRRINAEELLAEHAEERARASAELAQLQERGRGVEPRRAALETEKAKNETITASLGEEVDQLESTFASLTEQLGARKVELVELEGEQKSASSELERIERDKTSALATISRAERETTEAQEENESIVRSLDEYAERLSAFRAEQERVRVGRDEISQRQSAKRAQIVERSEKLKSERRGLESSVELAHELEVKIGELRAKSEGLLDRGKEEFGVDLVHDPEPVGAVVDQERETGKTDEQPSDPADGSSPDGSESRIETGTTDVDETGNADAGGLDAIFAAGLTEIREALRSTKGRLKMLGNVNLLAYEEYETERERRDFLSTQVADLKSAEQDLVATIDEINETAQRKFFETFEKIRENFGTLFEYLFEEGDEADLIIEEGADDLLEARIEIVAKPRNKRPHSIDLLSGGEKTLTAIALLFAIYLVKPSPFCILDEVDAPLDDANIERFVRLVRRFDTETQFIIVTHNKKTMTAADTVFGVTQQENGVSEILHHTFIQKGATESMSTESIDS